MFGYQQDWPALKTIDPDNTDTVASDEESIKLGVYLIIVSFGFLTFLLRKSMATLNVRKGTTDISRGLSIEDCKELTSELNLYADMVNVQRAEVEDINRALVSLYKDAGADINEVTAKIKKLNGGNTEIKQNTNSIKINVVVDENISNDLVRLFNEYPQISARPTLNEVKTVMRERAEHHQNVITLSQAYLQKIHERMIAARTVVATVSI